MANVAFLGLGVMGFPMAGWLRTKGHEVTVYNRTRAKSDKWREKHGGRVAATPAEAAKGAEIVLSCVGDDPDLREIALGKDGALAAMAKGAIFCDHTTASAGIAREIAAAGRARGVQCLDAPVSGGQAGAENGKLTVMVGGDADAFAKADPVIRSYSHNVKLLGPAGSGQLTKMVNQIAIAGAVQGLAEALNFARKAGLDPATVIDTISKGAAQSWQMENRWKTMSEGKFDFGFAVEWMRKDLRICLQEARENGAELPVAALVDQFYADVVGMGGKRWDTSSLIARLNRNDKR
ncbi:MAG TPA: NAD(P)-dependent oxidoreductase [Gammaproteobacteria bacterium]|nr:NAD(P)-dependent oxidoreductase [Gammaproteobacteria bacterium]